MSILLGGTLLYRISILIGLCIYLMREEMPPPDAMVGFLLSDINASIYMAFSVLLIITHKIKSEPEFDVTQPNIELLSSHLGFFLLLSTHGRVATSLATLDEQILDPAENAQMLENAEEQQIKKIVQRAQTYGTVREEPLLEPVEDPVEARRIFETYLKHIPEPTNCQPGDFELPSNLKLAFQGARLPPFITTETFGTFVALSDGWTPGFAGLEFPIVSRLVHLIDAINWNCAAVYSSTWLDALTKKDPLLRSPKEFEKIVFHASSPRQLCMAHAWAAVVNEWQATSFPSLSAILGPKGFNYADLTFDFDPEVDIAFDIEGTGQADKKMLAAIASRNCYRPKTMGAIVARQLTEYGRRDGFNMYGTLSSDGKPCEYNCRRYDDPTGYSPGERRPRKRRFRWQPLVEDDDNGYFSRQAHVTPHIGSLAKLAIISRMDLEKRSDVENPPRYWYNAEAFLVARRLALTATDDMMKAKIEFYDDKIQVIFAIISSVLSYGASFEQVVNFVFGITAGEYDSVIAAWNVKIKTDLVRPTTWIQNRLPDQIFNTYAGPLKGVQNIRGGNFESYVRVMPHSEYVSASAVVCQSLKDFTEEWMDLTDGQLNEAGTGVNKFTPGGSIPVPIATDQTGRNPPFIKGSSRTEPGVSPKSDLTLVATSMTDLRNQCGQSRLDGGMHFTRSVPDGYKLGQGIGTQAARYSLELLGDGGWDDEIPKITVGTLRV